jgi:EmrB/QacA subfamily drug resistance transporter
MTSTVHAPEQQNNRRGGGAPKPSTQAPSGGLSHRQIMTILIGLMLGMFLAALDQTIVSVAMPKIANDLQGLNLQAWVTTAYLITATITTPLYGKLSDLYGRKPFYLAAISIFVIGSAASSFAGSMYMLAAFRAFQGIGAGGLMSLAFTILGDIVSPRERAKYMGYFLAVFGASSVLGPVVGGALSGADSILGIPGWRWVFLVNVPIGLVALGVVAKVLNVPHNRRANHRIDWWGGVALIVGLVPLLIAAQQGQTWGWGDPKSIACYVVSVVGIVAFIAIERVMKDHALIPLRLFSSRTFSLIVVASVIIGVAMFGGITLIPQYLQIVKGASPTVSGLDMLPMMVGLMGASMGSGQVTSRTGRYKIFPIIGSVLIVVAALLFTRLGADSPMWQPMIYMFVFGAGVGLCMQTLNLAAQNAAPAKDMGVSTAAATFFRQTGGTLGVAVFLSILFSTVGNKITAAITSAAHTAGFQAALHDPKVLANPADKSVLAMLSGGGGGNTSSVLQNSSFIQRIDPRLAEPFKVGFTNSIDLVFWVAAAVAVLAFITVWFIKEIPLRTTAGMAAAMEGAEGMVEEPTDEQSPTSELGRGGLVEDSFDDPFADGVGEQEGRHSLATLVPESPAEITTRLPAVLGGTPIGGLVRRTDGSPVPGATLTLINHGGQQVARCVSGRDGRYQLIAPLDGVYVLIASSVGHQPQASTLRVAGEGMSVDVRMAGTARATGTVRPANGDGVVPGATVTLTDQRGEVVGAVTTGADGRYTFAELLGGPYTLVVSAASFRPTAVSLVVPDSGDAVADVELSGAARLTGTTRTGANGRPVADARVTLVDPNGRVVASTNSDENGNYTFSDLPSGDYTVIASGYPPVSSRQQVLAGQDSLHDVRLSHSDH